MSFGETVVHVNPWSEAGEYESLPKADQIWITDSLPEHLDLKAIRAVSQDHTQLIVDSDSAQQLDGLLDFVLMNHDSDIVVGDIGLQAVPTYRAEMLPDGPSLKPGNGYIASFGDFRLLLAGQAHFFDGVDAMGQVDVAVLNVDDRTSLSADQAAGLAEQLSSKAVFPYQYGEKDPARLAELLDQSGTMVVPLSSNKPAGPQPLGVPPDRVEGIAELMLEGKDPEPELLKNLFGARESVLPLLLPDLMTLDPYALRISTDGASGTRLLRLTNVVWNAGYGPLELWGKVNEDGTRHDVVQRIFMENDEFEERPVGEFIFHPGHNHWHLDSFAMYELWSLQSDGNLDEVVATSDKVSYCLRDIRRIPHPNQRARMGYGTCTFGRQGMSVGWADVYDYYLPGQEIDITGLKDGRYALLSTADPFNLIQESDESNNAAVVYVEIDGRRVSVVDS